MMTSIWKTVYKHKVKGSASLEAAMIFPLIMLIIFGIVYLTIVHYQNNVLIAESLRAMNRAGAYWQYDDMNVYGDYVHDGTQAMDILGNNNYKLTPAPFNLNLGKDAIINIEMIKKRNPYRTIVDVIDGVISNFSDFSFSKKNDYILQYTKARIANLKFEQYTKNKDVKVFYDEKKHNTGFMFFGNDLEINVGNEYINPLMNVFKYFLGENGFATKNMKKDIVVNSVISNQAEFIRNLDTVYDLGSNVYNIVVPKKDDIKDSNING